MINGYLEVQRACYVIEQNFAKIAAARQMVSKDELAPQRNVSTELVPFRKAHDQRLFEGLDRKNQVSNCRAA
jgi:hypothetical protein